MATTTNQIAPLEPANKGDLAAYMDDMRKAMTDMYAVPSHLMLEPGFRIPGERRVAKNPLLAAPYHVEFGPNFSQRAATPFGAMEIIEDKHMVETVRDFSDVRSPARAMRRLRSGKRKHSIPSKDVPLTHVIQAGNTFVMHPETARTLKSMTRKIAEDVSKRAADNIVNAMLGI